MPRKPRLFLPRATYHVYCRVARGEFVFGDVNEAAEFVETARHVRDLDGWKILAWCLMGNHYHLVVSTDTVPLWRSMARLQGRVSRGFNKRRRYLGRLWQSRYKARLIDSQDYFLQVVSYVHLNPVAAGIVDDPADYLQSGHREILGLCTPRLVDLPAVFVGYGSEVAAKARKEYLSWVRAVAEARWFAQSLQQLPWWAGASDAYEVVSLDQRPDAKTFDGLALEENRPTLELDDFVGRFEFYSGHTMSGLSSPQRSPALIQGRVELTLLAVGRYGFQSRAIAALILKNRSSLTRWLNTGLHLQHNDSEFRHRIDSLDHQIASTDSDNAAMRYVAP
jgi:REP element-mobilizing transposase RayT